MVSRDPIRVVGGRRGNGGAAGSFDGSLGLLRRRGLLRTLARLALLREVGRNPDGVEEVDDTNEAGQEEEVEEDTREKD